MTAIPTDYTPSLTLSATWAIEATPIYDAMFNAECLIGCPELDSNSCTDYLIETLTAPSNDLPLESVEAYASDMNEVYSTFLSCMCELPALAPMHTTNVGICETPATVENPFLSDELSSFTGCANADATMVASLDILHSEYSTLCSKIGVTQAAVTQDPTTTSTSGADNDDDTEEEASEGNNDGDGDGVSSAGRMEPVTATGITLTAMLGLCLIL